jgi:hypothetical protein
MFWRVKQNRYSPHHMTAERRGVLYFLIIVLQFKFKIGLLRGMLVLFLLHFREFDNVVNCMPGLTAQYASL